MYKKPFTSWWKAFFNGETSLCTESVGAALSRERIAHECAPTEAQSFDIRYDLK
jgi:hypothetical protein